MAPTLASWWPARAERQVHRIVGCHNLWVNEYTIRYDERPYRVAGIMEFRDGKVARESIYFGEPWDPPAWRAQWASSGWTLRRHKRLRDCVTRSSKTASVLGMRHSEALDELRTADGRSFRVEPIDQAAGVTMPDEFEPRRLVRRTFQIVAVLAVVGLVLLLAPGLGEVRHLLTEARPEWVALAIAFEALSCVSYVLMFRPIFCHSMPWRTSWEIGLSELAAARSCRRAEPAASPSAPGSCVRAACPRSGSPAARWRSS